jgi:hypothetical protein
VSFSASYDPKYDLNHTGRPCLDIGGDPKRDK